MSSQMRSFSLLASLVVAAGMTTERVNRNVGAADPVLRMGVEVSPNGGTWLFPNSAASDNTEVVRATRIVARTDMAVVQTTDQAPYVRVGQVGPCRGTSASNNPHSWYSNKNGFRGSLEDCQALCTADSACKAIEFSTSHCELWTREPQATDSTKKQLVCMKKASTASNGASGNSGRALAGNASSGNCNCLDHMEASKCHDHFGPKFRDAFLAGSLCVRDPVSAYPWCYTSLECMDAPGLGLSSQKTCKYRNGHEDACQAPADMCDCFPVEESKDCHPHYAKQFHAAMVENSSACVEDDNGAFCYTSMSCNSATASSQGKCKYMYVAEGHKKKQCTIPSDEVDTYTEAPAPTPETVVPGATPVPTPVPTPETPRPTFDSGSDPVAPWKRAAQEEAAEETARVNREMTQIKNAQTEKSGAPKAKCFSLALVGVTLVMPSLGH